METFRGCSISISKEPLGSLVSEASVIEDNSCVGVRAGERFTLFRSCSRFSLLVEDLSVHRVSGIR